MTIIYRIEALVVTSERYQKYYIYVLRGKYPPPLLAPLVNPPFLESEVNRKMRFILKYNYFKARSFDYVTIKF